MGWNNLIVEDLSLAEKFKSLKSNDFYFVHSYVMKCHTKNNIVATVDYGNKFVAVVCKDNILGVQFHPEKSQIIGQQFLKEFLSWKP